MRQWVAVGGMVAHDASGDRASVLGKSWRLPMAVQTKGVESGLGAYLDRLATAAVTGNAGVEARAVSVVVMTLDAAHRAMGIVWEIERKLGVARHRRLAQRDHGARWYQREQRACEYDDDHDHKG